MSFKRDEVDLVNSYNGKTYLLLNGESDFDRNILRLFDNVVNWDALLSKCVLLFELGIS